MALSLASPGIKVREVDLTRGGITNTTSISAGIAAPFAKGPVEEVVTITNEDELKKVFGTPSKNNNHYEYWYSASNFLSYGGSLKVVRCTGDNLKNANAGVSVSSTTLLIKNFDHYTESYSNPTTWFWAAKNPGYWSEGVSVRVIDNFADQIISGINTEQTTSVTFQAAANSANLLAEILVGAGTTVGIVTTDQNYTLSVGQVVVCDTPNVIDSNTTISGIGTGFITLSKPAINSAYIKTTFDFGTNTTTVTNYAPTVGMGVTQTVVGKFDYSESGTISLNGHLKGIITGIGASSISVRVVSHVSSTGVETLKEYTENTAYSFNSTSAVNIVTSSGVTTATATPSSVTDWYNSQNILDVANGDSTTLAWRSIAPKPRTNSYVTSRGGSNDALHVVVVDSTKANNVSGTSQEILESFYNLSKASDTEVSASENVYYKDYLAKNSRYIYSGKSIGDAANTQWGLQPVVARFTSGFTAANITDGTWGSSSAEKHFNLIGNRKFNLTGGADYSTPSGGQTNVDGYSVSLTNITDGYAKLANPNEVSLNFILQGGASLGKNAEISKAKYLISLAENRKDCVAFISPYRESVVNVSSTSDQLKFVTEFFGPLTSSSYAVFDSGYQYVYDRFNQQFVYMPCSSDVAGLCARTDIDQYPWYSPAGKVRGSLKFAVKLAYNPNQDHRDRLYSERINPIISSPGSGVILFGDKTALSYQSAFDRINVRRLFIAIEQAIKGAADAQLFEFNDATTRANFVNIVEPYLRDIQIKRGITDFLLVCDETNNTPDVIDRNEFIADIYVKPARSINFIGLTFVATRTGVSFQTVVGTV